MKSGSEACCPWILERPGCGEGWSICSLCHHPARCQENVLLDQHGWLRWCLVSFSSGGSEAEAQPGACTPAAPNTSGGEGASSAWPDLSHSTHKHAAMRKAETSRQGFGYGRASPLAWNSQASPKVELSQGRAAVRGYHGILGQGGIPASGQLRGCLQPCCLHVGFPRSAAAETR